jgi:hypothetical protein
MKDFEPGIKITGKIVERESHQFILLIECVEVQTPGIKMPRNLRCFPRPVPFKGGSNGFPPVYQNAKKIQERIEMFKIKG